jgi:hypothetical protein
MANAECVGFSSSREQQGMIAVGGEFVDRRK